MIVITGASGRLGRSILTILKDKKVSFRGLGRRDSEDVTGVDYNDTSSLRSALRGASEIWHLAGGVRGKGKETPDKINHVLTTRLLDAATQLPSPPKILFVSSTAVYGDRSNLWVTEDMPATPNTRYGRSKLEAEAAIRASGMPFQVVRMGTIYGPNVPFTAEKKLSRSHLWLPGEGRCYIPMIHINDAAAGIIKIAEKLPTGETIHLADADPILLADFYSLVCKELNTHFKARFWSTWVPSYVQSAITRQNERLQSKLNLRPHWTPDMLKLFTSSVRVNTQKLREDLKFELKYPSVKVGIRDLFHT